MKDSTVNVIIRKTTDYDRFRFMDTNRDVVQGHINNLKIAMQEHGNLTQVQPIVVNEKGDVIDGQNRLIACKELGIPVYYSVVEGLDINDARQMNILHRNWTNIDYAKSYATQGNQNYIRFLSLVEDYSAGYSNILMFIYGAQNSMMFNEFKEGDLVVSEETDAEVRQLLDLLEEVTEILPITNRALARAWYAVFHVEGYDQKRMVRQLRRQAATMKHLSRVEDNLRQLEEVYNRGHSDANRLRFY